MVLAVLERRGGIALQGRDVYAATVGGARLTEPAGDLALLLAVASRATFQMGYLLEVDGQARATAVTVHGCVDPTGRPVRMPSWLSEMALTTG